jgi:hypothetical protein
MCRFQWALIALLFFPALVFPQAAKKKPPNPNEVEIRLSDGSRVRMLILQKTIDIETKYGRLTAPTTDLRRIEFGIRPPPEVALRVDDAIKRLNHESFQEREKAVKELVTIGAPAYLALHRAAKTKEAEVAQRANLALEQIRKKIPESKLRIREDDMIQTAEFTVVGRVLNSTITAKSAIFGESPLNVTDLRGIRWMGHMAEVEVTIDATKYAVDGMQWMDTGIEMNVDDEISVKASGQVDLMINGGGQYVTGPAGSAQWGRGRGGHPPGALLARIGENGSVFLLGESYKGTATNEGKLYLQISPTPWQGNPVGGSYKVNITGGTDTQDR